MWSFILSGIVYIIAFWAASAYLRSAGLEAGWPKHILCSCFAFALSWMAGSAADWVAGPAPAAHHASAGPKEEPETEEDPGERASAEEIDSSAPDRAPAPRPTSPEAETLKAITKALQQP